MELWGLLHIGYFASNLSANYSRLCLFGILTVFIPLHSGSNRFWMMPAQPTHVKKTLRKKMDPGMVLRDDSPCDPSSSSIGATSACCREETNALETPGSSKKPYSLRATSSKNQRTPCLQDVPCGTTGVPEERVASHRIRSRNCGNVRSVGARMSRQMEPNSGRIFEEDVFMAVAHYDSADNKIKRPKPAAKIYQNKSHNRSAPSSICRPLFMPVVTRPVASQLPTASSLQIPNDVLNDICFRFLINIPDDEKSSIIRICFQIELAHWFYMDFYCKGSSASKCPEIGLRDFIRQIFSHCDFLSEFSERVDQVIEQWREYKSSVPTYGAILLDSTLDFVLLVQGYARNSWGFPKGKVNESEEPTNCAVREVAEEVGFDISDKIRDKLLIQKFINETLTRLYIVTDVPVDFSFAPRTRNEIGKIQWFSVWDLPMDRNDQKTCERIGLVPNNFYTVIPFVSDLQAYVMRQQSKRNKPKLKNTVPLNIGARSASAFDPVLPQQRVELIPSVFNSLFPAARGTSGFSFPSGSVPLLPTRDDSPPSGAFFKPLNATPQTLSFTGPSFMQLVSSGAAANSSCSLPTNIMRTNAVARPVPTMPKLSVPVLGIPVYEAIKKHNNERKSASMDASKEDLIPLMPAPLMESPCARIKETTAQRRARRLRNKKSERDVDLEEFSLSSELQEITHTPITDVKVEEGKHLIQLCEAWKSFKLDVSSLFIEVA